MKRIAIYPGSFNPFHKGHLDVVKKILPIFDEIHIACGVNPNKNEGTKLSFLYENSSEEEIKKISVFWYKGLLVEALKDYTVPIIIIKGLRNTSDFEYEKTQQYWNEDLGIIAPVMYIIADRKLTHISSSAIRMIDKLKEDHVTNLNCPV